MDDADIWCTAGTLISLYGGDEATLVAARQTDALLDQATQRGISCGNGLRRRSTIFGAASPGLTILSTKDEHARTMSPVCSGPSLPEES